ncbi:signal recognition particle protein [Granulicella mallensis]|jgi:signal recognition particle subunit SRP54|uniref:Signal recognition particle protein n=1 Tax=Granulicella mallensis (strain ATCC BAA-1857 / DSM 23137 / MP5ACTX8) TaxID=682795 RepID=G8NRI3_GRAMM|nr:signal recognition particle protein [Granulicella mallensis]AEU37341.1 signal recognition particle protein [Granulicella mallensis MP5ACTX8]
MFENLSEKLQRSFKTLRGQGTLTDENINDALREIRLALLESDVNLNVAKDLIEHIRTKALGSQVATALSPAEQIVKIVRDELVEVLGRDTARFKFASQPPTVILMAGLQGSGKTTTSGKLAQWLKKGGHRPMLVSVDVYRPAAREQLKVVAQSINAQIYEGDTKGEAAGTPLVERLAREARREAANYGCDILIVDTAGRLGIDEALMEEMALLKKQLNPSEILFVADAMTGQDAVNSAKAFNDKLTITGSILTKMDGDSRGGAALSIRQITGQPVKFLGTGEKSDAFEPFHPDRIVGRILGMGDIATLLERADEKLDKTKAEAFAKKALSGDGFTLEDFREQLRQIKKLGSMQSILKMLPSVGPFAGMQQAAANVDESQFTRVESIINSMTNKERQNSSIINGSRRKRIAMGAGVQVSEVNNLLKQHAQMSKMFKTMGAGGSKMQQRLMSQMQGGQRFGR